ncbi:MAG: bleomycin resistance family protein [Verrucomicrobia bacterium]|nr:bleomycin resistance family protein [Verrucomicrobiota bacterium]
MTAQGAASVFQVASVDAALRSYTDVLGFAEDFRFGNYAGVKLDEALIHLCGHREHSGFS